jgi:adrenergic receptor alpha-1D
MDLPFEINRTELVIGLTVTQPGIAIPYIITLAIFAIVGTFGNILIIGTMTTGSNKNVVGNFFIVNLAICDIVITAFINPMAITGKFMTAVLKHIAHGR